MTLTPTETGYLADFGYARVHLPKPEQLKADTLQYLLNEMIPPAAEEAGLLSQCDLSYDITGDWDGPFHVVQVVLTAPRLVHERLQDKSLYGQIISCMFQVCEDFGSDALRCRDD